MTLLPLYSLTTLAPLLLFVSTFMSETCPSFSFNIVSKSPNPFLSTSTTASRESKRRWPVIGPRVSFNGHRSQTIRKMGTSSRLSSKSDNDVPLLSDLTRNSFHKKSILLTGASRGLGKSLAHAISTCHSPSLLILSGRDEVALKEVQQECLLFAIEQSNNATKASMKVKIVVCDLGDKTSVEGLACRSLELAEQYSPSGRIDILINNGGISSRSSFLETKLDVDETLMQVNFFSGAALAKRLVPGMVEKGDGMLIWISSVQGKLGTPCRTSYAASKFAVQGYCEALRSELASSNVSVHIVSPGYIRTNLSLSAVMGNGKAYSKMDETTANGANPDEVATNILNSAIAGKTDFIVAASLSAQVALWLKFLVPSFLESMLVKRFEKQKMTESKKK